MAGEIDSFALIKRSVRLSDYIQKASGAKLVGVGPQYRCACPIHGGDNDNGFSINDKNGLWKCFTRSDECGGGSVIDFWMKYHKNSDLSEALEALAKEGGVSLPKRETSSKKVSTSRMYSAFEDVTEACVDYLLDSDNKDAITTREYLEGRGVTEEIIEDWQIGLIPSGKRDAMEFMLESCDDKPALIESGILRKSEDSTWVPQAGRLVFPVFDGQGRPVAFGARKVDGVFSSGESKYINTEKTRIYDKSKILYGMDNVTKDVKTIVVVEGYLDVIGSMESSDDESSVALASCGTGFTKEQAEYISHNSDQQIFAFDGDTAGAGAIASAISRISSVSKNVGAVFFPPGVDPWDMHLSGDSIFDYCKDKSVSAMTAAVEAKWLSSGENESALTDWVKKTVPSLAYTNQKSELVTRTAEILGKSLSAFKREVGQGVTTGNSFESSSSTGESQLTPRALEFVRGIMQMDDSDRDAALASLRPWKRLHRNAAMSWLPISSDHDLAVLKRIVLGMEASSSPTVDRELAMLIPSDDAQARGVNMGHIIGAMGAQLLSGMADDAISKTYLVDSIREIKACLASSNDRACLPEVLATLIETAVDMERLVIQHDQEVDGE